MLVRLEQTRVMGSHSMFLRALVAGFLPMAWAQQFAGTEMFTAYPGLSPTCQEALATNVTCPPYLGIISESNGVMTSDQVNEACINNCYTSLESARTTIASACTLDTDVIVVEGVAYPATYIVDNYLFTYRLSCRKDSTTGQYCDPMIEAWSNQSLSIDQECSDCWLGGLAIQLGSPFGYDEGLAEKYAALLANCSATGSSYSYASPTPYALNATTVIVTATATSTPEPTCTGSYIVQETDDCNSVAQSLNVSTYSILYSNNLDLYCQDFSSAIGSTLCIPPQCDTYVWQTLDSCNSVVGSLTNVTIPQFLAWNPNFNSLCQNAVNFIGYVVCISPPGGYLNHTTGMEGNSTAPTEATTAAPAPTNAVNGTNTYCGAWYTVVEGDQCSLVSLAHGLSLTDFYFLNPEIDQGCTNLLLGEAYCVAPVGEISTYPNYPVTTPLFTVPPATFSPVDTDIPTSTSQPEHTFTETPLPLAPDTLEDCEYYRDYDPDYPELNLCKRVAKSVDVTTDNLLEWNPSLPSDMSTCALQPGYRYCALKDESYEITDYSSNPNWDGCLPVNATEPTTVSDCNCFTITYGSFAGGMLCSYIESFYNVTVEQLQKWNPWLAGDCDTALYANLDAREMRAVCVGVGPPKTWTFTTITLEPSAVTSSAIATPAAPTQTDIVAGCQKYYTVASGDDCSTIESMFGITLAQLYDWNPSIGETCTNLWLGYAYCVKGPSPTTKTTTTTTTTNTAPSQTQTGIAPNCNKYHTVVSGESCAGIESSYGITFAQLYEWNPAIGDNCQSLWVGYDVCVGVS
ncbi:hypothetical protein BDW75DRAFT_245169 [Aspergillus navahoensis]